VIFKKKVFSGFRRMNEEKFKMRIFQREKVKFCLKENNSLEKMRCSNSQSKRLGIFLLKNY